jgi:hypothetical protein
MPPSGIQHYGTGCLDTTLPNNLVRLNDCEMAAKASWNYYTLTSNPIFYDLTQKLWQFTTGPDGIPNAANIPGGVKADFIKYVEK